MFPCNPTREEKGRISIKNLLILLLCTALLCGAFTALAEDLTLTEMKVISDADASIELDDIPRLSMESLELQSDMELDLTQELAENAVEEVCAATGDNASNDGDNDFRIDENGVLTNYYGEGGDVVIPWGVTKIGDSAFSYRTMVTSVTIPESVTSIGEKAFYYCTSLASVTIPNSVTSIGDSAFDDCTSLASVTIPNSVISMGKTVFSGCDNLTSIIIQDGVTSIWESAFSGCTGLTSVTIPDSVTSIGGFAFYGCTGLTSVTIPGSDTNIGERAFLHCTGLTSVTISGSVTNIGESAFWGCTSLTSITIPGNNTTIGPRAFVDCTALTSVTLSGIVTRIETQAFNGCTSLMNITIPACVTYIDGNPFYGCPDTLVIHGQTGSIAEKFAETHGYEFDDGTIKPTKITITNGKTISVDLDSKKQLNVKLTPDNAETTLTWTSSDESIATVSAKGLVKGIKKGTATITVTTKNGKTASIKVKVVAPVPTKVIIKQGKSATLYMGNTLKLTTQFAPAKAESKLTWSSSKPAVATVSSKGVVTPKKAGTAKITVKTANGKKASITVKVVDAKSVKLKEGKSKTLKVGKKLTLHATVSPAKVKTKLTWTSSDTKVATVSSKGVVTAKKEGTVKITVKTANGKSATIQIVVKK